MFRFDGSDEEVNVRGKPPVVASVDTEGERRLISDAFEYDKYVRNSGIGDKEIPGTVSDAYAGKIDFGSPGIDNRPDFAVEFGGNESIPRVEVRRENGGNR